MDEIYWSISWSIPLIPDPAMLPNQSIFSPTSPTWSLLDDPENILLPDVVHLFEVAQEASNVSLPETIQPIEPCFPAT
ncbi:hypothetical protein EPA93_28025 [Ktedonosporobacter rubrisoli]|uniref:Uncharacterized protein n=1 Tax=Ktedonosporobacter rubrisoli TaxID=2509675 RepID=A0A4P6JVC5_KTERU|nr:hypothetical protein [Ktedonosporobacter rubrisoli]QBD79618.1 hypothetical protein EPA93_28025 [Ktedonosporobacter rubrisoli]